MTNSILCRPHKDRHNNQSGRWSFRIEDGTARLRTHNFKFDYSGWVAEILIGFKWSAEAMRTAVFWPWIEDEVDQSSAILARIIDGEDELIGEFINLVAGLFCRRWRIVKWGWASKSTSMRHKTLKGTFVLWPAWASSFYWGCLI